MPIRTDRDGRVLTITIDRPEARNSLDLQHFGALAKAWEDFRDDDELWVAIVTGVDDVFCVGADLKRFIPQAHEAAESVQRQMESSGSDGLPPLEDIPATAALTAVLRQFPLYKPVIAAVNGICAAGGMEMLLGTDLRVAAEDAAFQISEPRRGLFPGGGTTVRLPRQIPYAKAMEILLLADPIPAEEALAVGIVNKVVPRDQVMKEARNFAERILLNGPLSVRATKQSVVDGLGMPLEQAYEQELIHAATIFATEDAREGPKAFAEKRDPVWKGR